MSPREAVVTCAVALLLPGSAAAQAQRIELSHLNHLAAKAAEVVDVSVDQSMLKQTAGFLSGKGGDDEKLRELISGITGIYVKGFEFTEPNVYSNADIETIRKQVTTQRWTRIVGVRGKDDLAEVYFWREKDVTGGVVIIAADARQLTVVNVVGRVDLAALAALGPMIPKLSGEASKLLKK